MVGTAKGQRTSRSGVAIAVMTLSVIGAGLAYCPQAWAAAGAPPAREIAPVEPDDADEAPAPGEAAPAEKPNDHSNDTEPAMPPGCPYRQGPLQLIV